MHPNAWLSFERHVAPLLPAGWKVLELGPGRVRRSQFRTWALKNGVKYHFADIRNGYDHMPGFVAMPGEEQIDAPDGAFDAAVALCMTHNVRRIWRWLPEVSRVIRAGGLFTAVCNITWLTNRYPTDFGRIYQDGWTTLLTDAGMTAETLEMCCMEKNEAARKHQWGKSHCTDLVVIGRKA